MNPAKAFGLCVCLIANVGFAEDFSIFSQDRDGLITWTDPLPMSGISRFYRLSWTNP